MASVKFDALSDAELLTLSREGDNDAFAVLWERHRLAGIVAARSIASTLDADDLVSGAYLKILELVRSGQGPTGAFRPYLYRVISSLAADTYRSPAHSHTELPEIHDPLETSPWEEGAFDLSAATQAFETLPERWQAVLWYSEVEGLAPRQVAPILGVSANSVSALSARAREGLQSAWVEAHVNMRVPGEDCRATRGHLQRYLLGKLTSRRSRDVATHLETCASCTAAAAESRILNKQLALVLVTIFLGGAPAAALLRSLGSTAAFAGAAGAGGSSASSTVAAAGGVGSSGGAGAGLGAGASGAAGISAGAGAAAGISAGVGAGAGIGVGTIALATAAMLTVAAVGGVLVTRTIANFSAEAPPAEIAAVDDQGDSESGSSDAKVSGSEEGSSRAITETKESVDGTLTTRASTTPRDPAEKPTSPRPPHPSLPPPTSPPPEILPPVVPPTAPFDIIAGYQCYVPHVDTGEFELIGLASLPETIEISLDFGGSTSVSQVNVNADRTWSSGPLAGLDDFLNGISTAEVRLLGPNMSSIWETATATQCAGTGPTVVTNIALSEVCYSDPVNIDLHGQLSEAGVIFARHVEGGSITTIIDPQLDGVEYPSGSAITWNGILTGTDYTAPHFWGTLFPLAQFLGTPTDYNAGNSGRLELRIQTPDYRTSPWIHVNQLVDIAVCSL